MKRDTDTSGVENQGQEDGATHVPGYGASRDYLASGLGGVGENRGESTLVGQGELDGFVVGAGEGDGGGGGEDEERMRKRIKRERMREQGEESASEYSDGSE